MGPPQLWSTSLSLLPTSLSLLPTQLPCTILPQLSTQSSTQSHLTMSQLSTSMATLLLMTTLVPTSSRTRIGMVMPLLESTVLPSPMAAPKLSLTALLMLTPAMLLMSSTKERPTTTQLQSRSSTQLPQFTMLKSIYNLFIGYAIF